MISFCNWGPTGIGHFKSIKSYILVAKQASSYQVEHSRCTSSS